MWLLLAGCVASGSVRGPGGDSAPSAGDDTATIDSGESASPDPCLPHMVAVDGAFCVDAFEATLEERVDGAWVAASPYASVSGRDVRASVGPGRVPQGYLSGDEAAAACAAAGKRLCTSEEWRAACGGAFPYGETHEPGACNDDYPGHPVIDLFGTSEGVWDAAHMNDPRINQQPGTVAEGGAHPRCRGPWGAFDMHGNLHEWVVDAEGTFRGGFYADASRNGAGCAYVTTAHDRAYHDYSTGFRCCQDL